MSEGERVDAKLLRQVDDRLERGIASDHPAIDALADTVPQADDGFRTQLEQRLVAHFQSRNAPKEEPQMYVTTTRTPRRSASVPFLTWMAAVLVVVVLGGLLLALGQRSRQDIPALATQITADEPARTLVVAARNIGVGETISEEMVALISLSQTDFTKLENSQPEREYFTDLSQVVGQVTTTAIFWFEPIEPVKLGQLPNRCPLAGQNCVAEPEGYYTIYLSLPVTPLESLGLVAGDRVDVLASADNQLTVIVEDALLAGIEPGKVLLATPSWKQSILVWLYQTEQPYLLRPHQGDLPAPADDTLVEFTFTSPEPLPEDYRFDLIVEVDHAQGYRLMDSPYTLDETHYTQRDTIMNFWYTDLEVVSIVDGTTVTIRLPQSDAANIEFMLGLGAGLTFNPDADQS